MVVSDTLCVPKQIGNEEMYAGGAWLYAGGVQLYGCSVNSGHCGLRCIAQALCSDHFIVFSGGRGVCLPRVDKISKKSRKIYACGLF